MEDLVNYVSAKSNLPRPIAQAATDAALDYLLQPHTSRLLKTYIDVTLHHPELSQGEKDLLIASRILFPEQTNEDKNPPKFND